MQNRSDLPVHPANPQSEKIDKVIAKIKTIKQLLCEPIDIARKEFNWEAQFERMLAWRKNGAGIKFDKALSVASQNLANILKENNIEEKYKIVICGDSTIRGLKHDNCEPLKNLLIQYPTLLDFFSKQLCIEAKSMSILEQAYNEYYKPSLPATIKESLGKKFLESKIDFNPNLINDDLIEDNEKFSLDELIDPIKKINKSWVFNAELLAKTQESKFKPSMHMSTATVQLMLPGVEKNKCVRYPVDHYKGAVASSCIKSNPPKHPVTYLHNLIEVEDIEKEVRALKEECQFTLKNLKN